jgi:tricarballylate dehydrogenase
LIDKFDIIIIGGGNAGLCAAISSVEKGKKVLLLENTPIALRGGNTKYTRDIRYMHENDKYTSGPYEFKEFYNDLSGVSGGLLDNNMVEHVLNNSPDIPEWMENRGVKFKKEIRGTLNLTRTNVFFMGGGKSLVNIYHNYLSKHGISVLYDSEVKDINIVENKIKSVTIKTGSNINEISANSFIICSGGFEANREWLKEIWGDSADNFHIRGNYSNTGIPLKLLIKYGAITAGDPKGGHMVAVDARGPSHDGGIVTRIDAIPLGIVVNKHGKRFYDEGEDIWPKRYAIWGHLVAEQDDQLAYAIIDSSMMGKFIPPIFQPVEADTIDELAVKLDIDRISLIDTVKEYNTAGKNNMPAGDFNSGGPDTIKIRKSHFYKPLDKKPFMGIPLRPGITFTYQGVKIDKTSRIITRDGTMENGFAAGEIASGNVLKSGYLAGFGLTIGTVFGRIAGKEAD